MTGVYRSARSRHLLLRLGEGDTLPGSLSAALRDEHVAAGWLQATGVVADVELRAIDPRSGGLGPARRVRGPVHVLSIEGSIGVAEGQPSASLRALLSREGEAGLETVAGEIASARVVGLEVLVTALDDVSCRRALDAGAGVWLIEAPASGPAIGSPGPPGSPASPASPASPPPRPAGGDGDETEADPLFPEPGDVVDHFAFGRCIVLKTDGDRLHLRADKDGRILEIAPRMLRLAVVDAASEPRRFRLERKT